jgi:putative aldouronate transport system substrate-binding protein
MEEQTMNKRLIAFILALMLLVCLFAGCSDKSTDSSASDTSAETETKTEEKKEEKKEEPKKEEEKKEEPKKEEEKVEEPASNFNETGWPVCNEPESFTIWASSDATAPEEFPMNKIVSEATNVYPEWICISPAAIAERKALMWASQDYPDVLGPSVPTKDECHQYGPMGILMPLSDLLDKYAVNFNQYADDTVRVAMMSSDGEIYFVPYLCEIDSWCRGYNINQNWLDALGLDMPTTLDEFTDVLRAFKDGDPNGNGDNTDEIPFAIAKVWSLLESVTPFIGNFGIPGDYQVIDGEVVNGYINTSFRDACIYLRDIYNEGLLDPEMFTIDNATRNARGKGEPAVYGIVLGYTPPWHFGDNKTQYTTMPLLKDANGNTAKWYIPSLRSVDVGCQLAITVACKNPEVVMRWCDYMMQPDNSIQVDKGPVGIMLDETYHEYGTDKLPAGYNTWSDWMAANRFQQLPRIMTPQAFADYNLPWEKGDQQWRDERDAAYLDHVVESVQEIAPLEDETEILTMYQADVQKYIEETMASWVTNNGNIEGEWENYLSTMEILGEGEIRKVKQQQYERYLTLLD